MTLISLAPPSCSVGWNSKSRASLFQLHRQAPCYCSHHLPSEQWFWHARVLRKEQWFERANSLRTCLPREFFAEKKQKKLCLCLSPKW
ncbi:hypothetical protein VIGAN_06156800 [Vigna angularis var. angularis]|uniref:Uncharacterized protein n=1 Tax=Vigna angularis var. angularis TaxID=157739 RepID=A0A0S3SC11_PHAAN|nr:hypothetical protein VIGAN_06156800 [Vigna angularis var. angularis]